MQACMAQIGSISLIFTIMPSWRSAWAGGGSGPGQSAPKSEPGSPANTGQWCVANVSPTRCIAPLGSASSVKAIHVGTALFDYQPLRQIR